MFWVCFKVSQFDVEGETLENETEYDYHFLHFCKTCSCTYCCNRNVNKLTKIKLHGLLSGPGFLILLEYAGSPVLPENQLVASFWSLKGIFLHLAKLANCCVGFLIGHLTSKKCVWGGI